MSFASKSASRTTVSRSAPTPTYNRASSSPDFSTQSAAKCSVGLPSFSIVTYPATSTGRNFSFLLRSSCCRIASAERLETIRQFRPSRVQTAATRSVCPSAYGRKLTGLYPELAESQGGRQKLVHWHCLAESEPLGEYPVCCSSRLTRLASGCVHDGSSGASCHEYVALLESSAWKTGKICSALFAATGNRLKYAFGSATMSSSASRSGSSLA